MEEHGGKSGRGREHTDFSDLIGKNGEFLLKWGFIISSLNFKFEFSIVRVFTNGGNNKKPSTGHDFGAGDEEGVFGLVISRRNSFFDFVGLPGEGRFVD